jgi:DNA repair protein RadC
MNTRINDLPDELRPREKMSRQGPGSLSDAELLAIFLRVGVKGESAIEVGRRLLATHGGLAALGKIEIAQLSTERGLGLAKAAQLAAAFELGSRVARERATHVPLDSPEAVYAIFAPQMRHLRCESLRIALLDSRLRTTRFVTISDGSINETIAHPRDILHPAVLHRAYGFHLVHNHPSGDPSPSRADRELTSRIAEAAALLQINFLDHIIIGSPSNLHDSYFSFQEAGLL